MASRLSRGSVPGCPREIALTWVFGSFPKAVASPQNSFVLVSNCACTSRPTTISYWSFSSIVAKIQRTDVQMCRYADMQICHPQIVHGWQFSHPAVYTAYLHICTSAHL